MEASRHFALGDGGAALVPFVEVAGRRDGGDGPTGTGLEVAGGELHDAGPVARGAQQGGQRSRRNPPKYWIRQGRRLVTSADGHVLRFAKLWLGRGVSRNPNLLVA